MCAILDNSPEGNIQGRINGKDALGQWFSKWGPRPPGGPRAECRGAAIIQSNIAGPCTFKGKKIEITRLLFGDIG